MTQVTGHFTSFFQRLFGGTAATSVEEQSRQEDSHVTSRPVKRRRVRTVGPSAPAVPTIGPRHNATRTIAPRARLAWDEKGWVKTVENGVTVYQGRFKAFDRRKRMWREFGGYVREEHGKALVYIADPPAEIQRHPKGPCFMLTNPPWFYLNWHVPAKNADDAILYMERVLWESLNKYGRG